MRKTTDLKLVAGLALFLLAETMSPAQTLYTNSFNQNVNYLTNGIAGTIWDGVYFGAGAFNNTGTLGPGATVQCDANITTAGTLTLQTTGTAWEGADDDGFYLFKVVPGDFSVIVHVVSPFNASAYNTAGLQAREFTADGDPFNGAENFISWTRFDEYGFANYLRNEVNGGVTQINPGDSPNTNYWLRMDRVGGTNFFFYQRATKTAAWSPETFPAPVNGGTKLVQRRPGRKSAPSGHHPCHVRRPVGCSIHRFQPERFELRSSGRAISAVSPDPDDQRRQRHESFLGSRCRKRRQCGGGLVRD